MGQINIGRAATAGFGVIAGHPAAVLMWGVVFFGLAVVPLALMFGALAPALADLVRSAPDGADPDMRSVMRFQGQLMAINSLAQLGQLAAQVLIVCAIFRAVLTPDDSRWLYLRLGMGELMAGLMMLFVAVLMVFGIFGAVLIAAIVVGGVAAASPDAAVVVGVVAGLALLVAALWFALRLSLATVMGFAQRSFPIVEAWKLTRGKVGALFLVGLLVVLLVILLQFVLLAVVGGLVFALAAGAPFNEAMAERFFAQPVAVWAAQLIPWVLGGGLILSLLTAVFTTLMTAPWAMAYRDLAPGEEAAAATFA